MGKTMLGEALYGQAVIGLTDVGVNFFVFLYFFVCHIRARNYIEFYFLWPAVQWLFDVNNSYVL